MNLTQPVAPNIDESTAARMAELFAALADPSRVRIIAALTTGEMYVRALAAIVGISESAFSTPHIVGSIWLLPKPRFRYRDTPPIPPPPISSFA